MRAAFATLVFAGLAVANPVANPVPQAVTSAISPSSTPPAGCYPNYSGTFEIGPVNVSSSGSSKRDLDQRNTQLGISLKNGILTDPLGRTGYIAANDQFQFDGPPQAGAIYTAGWTVCTDGRLSLGSDQYWYSCKSGDFSNLYYTNQGGQCAKVYLIVHGIDGAGGPIPGTATSAQTITATGGTTTAGTSTKQSTASGSGSSSSATGTAANATMTSSTSSSSSVTVSGSKTTATTAVPVGHHTTVTTAGTKTTVGGKTTTSAASSSSSSSSSSASAPSATGAAGPMATLGGEMLGLAAGILALAAL